MIGIEISPPNQNMGQRHSPIALAVFRGCELPYNEGMWIKELDPTVKLLASLLVFFTVMLFAAEVMFKEDAVFFATVAGVFGSIAGGLLMKLKVGDHPPPGSTTATTIQQVTQTPPDPTIPVEDPK